MSLIDELKQRKLVQWALAYAAAAFALLQGIDIVAQRFGWPESIERILIIALCVGFFIALLLAWYHGERGAQKVSGTELLLLALLLGIGGGLLWKFVPARSPESSSGSRAAVRATVDSESDSGAVSRVPASDKSIAVLPFANLSDEKANAFFADGMQDEILTKLSKITALHVVSRTSTQRYASAPDNLPEIARQLGVANILEGSVQKAGNAVHINVQLIQAATDKHLWAESYNRTLDDIFGVEGEVAQAVAEALKATLTGAERQVVAAKGTENSKAYEAYLRGRAADNSGASFLGQIRALDDYLAATREDPNFVQAWAVAAVVMSNLYFNGFDTQRSTADAVRHAAETAMQLQPDLAESLLARGAWLYRVQRDFPAATEMFKQALAKEPGNVDILVALFFVERRRGLWDDSIAHLRQAMARSPRDASLPIQGGSEIYFYMRRYDDARKLLQQGLAIAPDIGAARAGLAQVEQRLGNLDAADAWLAKVPKESTEYYERTVHADQLNYRRDAAGLAALMAPALAGPDSVLTNADAVALIRLGYAQRAAGQQGVARGTFERLARAFASRPGGIDHVTGIGPQSPLVYAGLGDWEKAIAAARHQIEFNRNDALEGAVAKVVLAQIYAQKGERDAALALLPELLTIPGDLSPALLTLDPLWDPIRNDPRFVALTKQPVTEIKAPTHE